MTGCECECGGAGLKELPTEDLIWLLNLFKNRKDAKALGMVLAIRHEYEHRMKIKYNGAS